VNITPEQAEQVIRYLTGPAKVEEAARMLGVPLSRFREDWTKGRRDSEHGEDTPEAQLYLQAMAARSRCLAVLRSDADAAAGTREASDKLALARELEQDAGPLVEDDDDLRKRSPDLRVIDLLESDDLTPGERADLRAEHEAWTRACLAIFATVLEVEARRREGRAA
jgi:hypothetical protein